MYAPIRALLWEQWRLLRWPTLIAVLLSLVIIGNEVASETLLMWPLELDAGGIGFIVALFYLLGLYFLLVRSDITDLGAGVPAHQLALPTRTVKIAAVVFLSRIITVGASLLAILTLHWVVAKAVDFPSWRMTDEILSIPMICALTLAVLQAVLWWPMRVRIALGFSLVFALLVQARFFNSPLAQLRLTGNQFVLLFLGAMTVSFIFAVLGVVRQRRAKGMPAFCSKHIWRPLRRRSSLSLAYPVGPARAQLWFEWRILGRGVLFATLVSGGMLALLMFTATRLSATERWLMPLLNWTFAPLLAAALWSALQLLQSFREHSNSRTFANMALPVRTATLAAARLKAGACGLTASYASILFLILLSWLLLGGVNFAFFGRIAGLTIGEFLSDLTAGFPPVVCVVAVFVLTTWTLLWLGVPVVIGFVATMMIVMVEMFLYSLVLGKAHANTANLLAASAAIVLVGALMFRAIWQKNVISTRRLILLAAFWPLSALSTCICMYVVNTLWHDAALSFNDGRITRSFFVFWGVLSILPILPFLSVPLMIERMRHR